MRWRLVGVLLAVMAITAGWTAWRAIQVRDGLLSAQKQAAAVQRDLLGGRIDAGQAALPSLTASLDRTVQHTQGPLWGLYEHVPLLGRNLAEVRRAAVAAAEMGSTVLPELSRSVVLVQKRHVLREGRVDLVVLGQIHQHVAAAAAGADQAQRGMGATPRWLIWPVAGGSRRARDEIRRLDQGLATAEKSLAIAPGILGAQGPRRVFVAVQNPAEARGTGGLIGAFAIVTTDRGRITLAQTGTDGELPTVREPVPSDTEGSNLWKQMGSTITWRNANLSPHFPDAASNLARLWEARYGQGIDVVVALDPLVMSRLLQAAGSVRLSDGTEIEASNVVNFVARDEYVMYPDVPTRKRVLKTLAATLFERVLKASDSLSLLRSFVESGRSGHLFVWSAHESEQAVLRVSFIGGALPNNDEAYLSVITQNFGGNKLDYYIRRKIRVLRANEHTVSVQVTLRNTAPLGLSRDVSVRFDKPKPPVPYGQAKVGLVVYGAVGSEVSGVLLDGKPQIVTFDRDHGHRIMLITLEIPRNSQRTIVISMTEPPGTLVYRQQPGIHPDELSIQGPSRTLGR